MRLQNAQERRHSSQHDPLFQLNYNSDHPFSRVRNKSRYDYPGCRISDMGQVKLSEINRSPKDKEREKCQLFFLGVPKDWNLSPCSNQRPCSNRTKDIYALIQIEIYMIPTRKPHMRNMSKRKIPQTDQWTIYRAPSSLSLETSPSTSSTLPPPCLGGGSRKNILASFLVSSSRKTHQ